MAPYSRRSRSRSRSPPRRRSRSPRRDRDRERDLHRSSSHRDDRDARRDGRGSERGGDDRYHRGGGRDERGGDRGGARRGDRPPAPPLPPTGGDGGWGTRALPRPPNSPGRPSQSLALPPQSALANPGSEDRPAPVKPIEPNFAPSGALAAETNTFQGVVLKYNEPPEARKPVRSWRLYVFKGKEQLELFHVHRQSAYLIGRDRIVADIPIDHPSTSKQHAVLQFRQVVEKNEFGDSKTLTKPFIIDLDSANGTMVNGELVPPSRYYELKSNDVLKFAFSTREYVLLAET